MEEKNYKIVAKSENQFDLILSEGEKIHIFTENELLYEQTNMSCGVINVYGINDLCDTIYDAFDENTDKFKKYTDKEIVKIQRDLFKTILFDCISEIDTGFILLSTNISNNDDFETIIHPVLERFKVGTTHNPNSGNDIILYCIDQNEPYESDQKV